MIILEFKGQTVIICTIHFNVQLLCIIPAEGIYVFHLIHTVNSYNFSKQHQQSDHRNGDVLRFLCSTDDFLNNIWTNFDFDLTP